MSPHKVSLFISYARADEPYRRQLETHLSALKREGRILLWHDEQVKPGANKVESVNAYLENARIILLLVSPDFMASDYCYGIEMEQALKRHKANMAWVIPIIVRPCDWEQSPVGKLRALPVNGDPVSLWTSVDKAWTQVATDLRQMIKDQPQPSVNPPSSIFPPIWNIPYPRNPFFTGQDALLVRLSTALKTGHATTLSQPHAISGLGGIGKTQIAIEYAYRHHQDYQAVLWAQADTRESLVSGYVTIAGLLDLPEKDERDQSKAVRAVMRWLTIHTDWLLILDNADDLALVHPFLPPRLGGHLLLTTRAQATGARTQRVEVEVMPQDVGVLFLLRRAKLTDAAPSDETLAKAICEELGGLPLALDQTGAYIEETQCSLSEYQQLYRTHRALLLKRRGTFAAEHPQSVATTWSLSFEKVQQKSLMAADLLRLCAFLHSDAIPVELIAKGARYLGSNLASVEKDDFALDEAITNLRAYSLIRRNRETKTLSIHRLVQVVIRDAMDEQTRRLWAERTVQAINEVFPEVSFVNWFQCERYLPHALACADLVEQEQVTSLEAARLLRKGGHYLYARARYIEAEALFVQALAIYEQQPEAAHLDVAIAFNCLAELYRAQGEYSKAEALFRQAFSIYEQQESYPLDMLSSINNLALLYQTRGEYEQAEALFVQALAVYEQLPGVAYPHMISTLHNLAALYCVQGNYRDAEPLLQWILSIREQTGADHPDMANNLNNLAVLYDSQGKYEQAEPLYTRALGIRERHLGTGHPDTADSLSNLASLYAHQGKYAESESLYRRALSIYEKAYGSEHPRVAASLNNLVALYRAWGRDELAEEPLSKWSLSIHEKQLEDPFVADNLNNLAALYYAQRKYLEAEPLWRRVLEIFEKQLEPGHPKVVMSLHNLAALCYDQCKYSEAEPLLKRALLILERNLEGTHPWLQNTRRWYASLLRKMGHNEEAAEVGEPSEKN